ncbi:CTP synthase [Candidatus Dependentiae bacterium]|nr:CTP synthase [Candidatus Dependentiae bacterium]
MTKFIFVSGGVISGVGKGVITASLGKIMKQHGYKTTLIKIDPYINYDAGTLRPTEHGEVWVTEDGGEIDQDLGNYERFLNEDIPKHNNITTGQIYKNVIDRERRGDYLGKTVQFIPHILDEIKARILEASKGYEIAIIELGGTVGDYENTPYLFAIKSLQLAIEYNDVAYVLVSYLPVPAHIQEMKTKPTQQAIRLLGAQGILPNFIVCRSEKAIDNIRKEKIELFSNIAFDNIISAPDLNTIYRMPIHLEEQGVGKKILKHFGLTSKVEPNWNTWQNLITKIEKPKQRVRIAIVGKYLGIGDYSLTDSYISIAQSLEHAGAADDVGVDIEWISADDVEQNGFDTEKSFDGVIIPGGFGHTGITGKLNTIRHARENNIPFLGLCYGLQLAVIEHARNVCNMKGAHTTEVDPDTPYPVIDIIETQKDILKNKAYGGTMRLGSYPALVKKGTLIHSLYSRTQDNKHISDSMIVTERHRHRYEVNPRYIDQLEQGKFKFSGHYTREDGTMLMEFIELEEHRFFVATQAHPEFKSRFNNAHPLFSGFVRACNEYRKEQELLRELNCMTITDVVDMNVDKNCAS